MEAFSSSKDRYIARWPSGYYGDGLAITSSRVKIMAAAALSSATLGKSFTHMCLCHQAVSNRYQRNIGYSKENLKIHTGVPPLRSFLNLPLRRTSCDVLRHAAHSGFYENALYKFTFTYLLTLLSPLSPFLYPPSLRSRAH